MNKVCVVIPVYNEEARVATVVREMLAAGFDVVAVDDGSCDGTWEALQAINGLISIRHCVNRGQGAALKTGTLLARNMNWDIIAHVDADGQHRLTDLQTMVDLLNQGDAEIIFGSRFMGLTSSMPWKKKIILLLAKIFTNHVLKLPFSDPQNGLRVFRASVLPKILWHKDDYQHCTEILTAVANSGVTFREVPMVVNYDDYATSKAVRPSWRLGWRLILEKLFDKL